MNMVELEISLGSENLPVPQRYNQLSHLAKRVTEFPSQTEIGDLDLTTVRQ
jgi:hypothetical protein